MIAALMLLLAAAPALEVEGTCPARAELEAASPAGNDEVTLRVESDDTQATVSMRDARGHLIAERRSAARVPNAPKRSPC